MKALNDMTDEEIKNFFKDREPEEFQLFFIIRKKKEGNNNE